MAEETGARVQSSIADSEEWAALVRHVEETKDLHLRDLLADEERCASMMKACATRDEVTDDGCERAHRAWKECAGSPTPPAAPSASASASAAPTPARP